MTGRPIIFSAPMVRAILREIERPGTGKTRRRVYSQGKEADPAHLARRLANGLDSANDDECWEWQRSRNRFGYGTLTIKGRTRLAHRLAYELSKGPIPDGLHVLHDCDNPSCINPSHLRAGTRSQNMADCHSRGRSRIPAPRMCGEANGSSKLKTFEIAVIRRMLEDGLSQASIARKFGVSQSNISKIKRSKGWPVLGNIDQIAETA